MLNGPALLRVFLVVIAAAVLTGLVQHYWIFDSSPPDAPKPAARPAAQTPLVRRSEPAPPRPSTPPNPAPAAVDAAQASLSRQPQSTPTSQVQMEPAPQSQAPQTEPETRNAALTPSPPPPSPQPAPTRPQPAGHPAAPSPPPPAPEGGPAEEIAAAESTDPRAIDLVDLNTGSLSELNGLKGGGAIGRAIIQRRPYASTDQLLSKRVLSRAIYQRIKDQVTVR